MLSPMTIGAGAFNAAISQVTDSTPLYGREFWPAYPERYGAAVGDIASQNFFGDFLLASVFHEDTRYVRREPDAQAIVEDRLCRQPFGYHSNGCGRGHLQLVQRTGDRDERRSFECLLSPGKPQAGRRCHKLWNQPGGLWFCESYELVYFHAWIKRKFRL